MSLLCSAMLQVDAFHLGVLDSPNSDHIVHRPRIDIDLVLTFRMLELIQAGFAACDQRHPRKSQDTLTRSPYFSPLLKVTKQKALRMKGRGMVLASRRGLNT